MGLPLLAQREPLFDHITSADGSPGNDVMSVFEDRRGYIWAGTTTGLARMEGTRIRTFHHDLNDSSSLAHDQVNGLAEDGRGTLWMATMAGLSKYDPVHGNFTSYHVPGFRQCSAPSEPNAASALCGRYADLGSDRGGVVPFWNALRSFFLGGRKPCRHGPSRSGECAECPLLG
ncbi:MAG: hypothetical protein IPG74_04980 [Flavobacteriales bacterium]|nr:hypothetical protein [Flavobacteriales bacterium]